MRSTSHAALLGLLVLWLAPAARTQAPDDLARLRSENEALRRELSATRSRLEALEALVRERLGGEPWTAPGAAPPGSPPDPTLQLARLSDDRRTLLVPDLRLPEDAGAAGSIELVEALLAGCRDLPLGHSAGAVTALASRLGAFDPGPQGGFLVPSAAWKPLAQGQAHAYPQRRHLEAVLRELAPCLGGARLVSVSEAARGPAAAPRIGAQLASRAGPLELELVAARVNGRLLLVRLEVPWFETNARAGLEELRRLLAASTLRGDPAPLPSPSALEAGGVRVLAQADPRTLRLPGYELRFDRLAGGEWGAVAQPLLEGGVTLSIGPLPQHDPRKAPYRVRPVGE